jgi:hypothetical protein
VVNTKPEQFTRNFRMRVDDRFLGLIDELRIRERPVMNRTEFVRKAIEQLAAKAGIKEPAQVTPKKSRKKTPKAKARRSDAR